jgi:hypothetical protein
MFSPVLRSAPAALDAVLDALDWPLRPQSVVFVFGPRGQPLVCVHIDGGLEVDGFFRSLTALVRPVEMAHSVFVGTVAPFSPEPAVEFQVGFLDGRDQFDALGVELIDWFLVDPTIDNEHVRAVSLAEATVARSYWARQCVHQSGGC